MFDVVMAFASTRLRNFQGRYPFAELAKGRRRVAGKMPVTTIILRLNQVRCLQWMQTCETQTKPGIAKQKPLEYKGILKNEANRNRAI